MKTNTKNIRNKDREKNESGEKKQREKKPFDKKRYRLQKYSNKHKINQWEERRKKAVLREFHKELKRNQQNSQTSTGLNDMLESTDETSNSKKKKGYAFYNAKQEQQCIKEAKEKRIQEAIRIKAEREEALRKYKEKKRHTMKVLSKKNKKGQPIMNGRMELLYEKIKQNLARSTDSARR